MAMSGLGSVVLSDADSTLTVQAGSPESSKLNVTLTQVGMSDKKPGTKDTLSKNVKYSVRDDFAINTDLARSISKTPDTGTGLALFSS